MSSVPMVPESRVAELSGKVALVTGAAGNIGRAVAVLIAERGATVVATDLGASQEQLAETAALCGDTARSLTFDVTNAAKVTAALSGIAEQVGVADLVFNNAGYQGHFANLLDYEQADFGRVIDVNVTGVFNVLQASARLLRDANKPGSIVNTASMAGVTGAPNMAAYSASKAAVIGLTKSAARDLAHLGIRVNAISPAFVGPGAMWDRQVELQANTPSIYFDNDPEIVAEQMIGSVPLRRYGTLVEVAEVAAFLLSDRSSYMTATNTEISGGAA